MKSSEIKKRIKLTVTYEFFARIFRFVKDYKLASCILAVLLMSVITLLFPYVLDEEKSMIKSEQGTYESTNEAGAFAPQAKVCLAGEVKNPGMYTLTEEDRIADAVNAAGGFTENADKDGVNLAQKLEDEQYIYIPNKNEQKPDYSDKAASASVFTGVVNINTASSEELQKLPGIGNAIAERIIEYRTAVGGFKSTDEIMNVKGIGDSIYEKIRNNITV